MAEVKEEVQDQIKDIQDQMKGEAIEVDVVEDKTENPDDSNEISFRLKVCNFPKFLKYPQIKQFLDSNLKGITWRKLKAVPGVGYFSLTSEEDTNKVFEMFNNMRYKGRVLEVKRVANEPDQQTRKPREDKPLKTASEITTPLAGVDYEEQLVQKLEESKKTAHSLIKQLKDAHALGAKYIKAENIVKPIIKSPVLTHYRNKCEFTVGLDAQGHVCVGFVSGRMADREVVIVPPFNSNILTRNMHSIVEMFTEYIKESGLVPFDEFKRVGFWKMLTVRDFVGDCMLIFTTHPLEDQEKLKSVQEGLVNLFINFGDVTSEIKARVTSIYWQTLKNASDTPEYVHLAGVPYIYESILGVRFRVSPATFFQTNSRGAEKLYNAIGDALGLPSSLEGQVVDSLLVEDPNQSSDQPEAKKLKPNEEEEAQPNTITETKKKSLAVLDICCGAGTIGQCLLRRLERSRTDSYDKCICVGVELIDQAVRDARVNAKDNGFSDENCRYLSGQAESIFPLLQRYLPSDFNLEESTVVGVLDPPRAGISAKVIISCRKLASLRNLVYVSCDPKAALKNIVDLCRPESKKFDGDPFKVNYIQPVDMFPQTSHFEWVVLLSR